MVKNNFSVFDYLLVQFPRDDQRNKNRETLSVLEARNGYQPHKKLKTISPKYSSSKTTLRGSWPTICYGKVQWERKQKRENFSLDFRKCIRCQSLETVRISGWVHTPLRLHIKPPLKLALHNREYSVTDGETLTALAISGLPNI